MMASDRDYFADEKIIRAKDLSEARRTLYDRYKHGYMIIDQKTVPMHGLMGLFGKNELEITYRLGSARGASSRTRRPSSPRSACGPYRS